MLILITRLERWQSGRMYYLGKVAEVKASRGFESPSLRDYKIAPQKGAYFVRGERASGLMSLVWGFEKVSQIF